MFRRFSGHSAAHPGRRLVAFAIGSALAAPVHAEELKSVRATTQRHIEGGSSLEQEVVELKWMIATGSTLSHSRVEVGNSPWRLPCGQTIRRLRFEPTTTARPDAPDKRDFASRSFALKVSHAFSF